MPATRIRGKSAVHLHGGPLLQTPFAPATTPVAFDNQTVFNLNNHPLLKIESVVPTVGLHHSRHSRLIKRSHSTVSSAYLRKVTDPRSRTVAALNRCNGEAPGGGGGVEEPEKTANPFPRIKRSKKEREKFPDRINLDRKGLTAIPLIDDEPQLRLLSLQHNLINVFHVPETTEEEEDEQSVSEQNKLTGTQSERGSGGSGVNGTPSQDIHYPTGMTSSTVLGKIAHRPFHIYNGLHSGRHRLLNGSSNGHICQNSNGGILLPSHASSTSTPSILINGVPNYSSRSTLANGKAMQLLNVNPKLILKKNQFVQSLYQPSYNSYTNLNHKPSLSTGKSISESGIGTLNSGGSGPGNNSGNSSHLSSTTTTTVLFCRYGETLQNLVFLDLYDNQIEKIGNLDGLKSLTVLLLGKNRIVDITGIICLKNTLRVLDLHGNRIANISHKICRLQELKSLNLAGNALRQISNGDFAGLQNLRELNLKRNRIKRVNGFEDLQHLERLWLCNNDIHKVEDMSCIAKAIHLKEITVENNPVSLAGDCCSFLVSYLPNLVLLSQMHVTEQVKRAAMAWRKSKESSDLNFVSISSDVGQSIRREEVISNARTNWELLRSQPQFVVNPMKIGRPVEREREKEIEVELKTITVVPAVPPPPPLSPLPINIPKLGKKSGSSDSQESAGSDKLEHIKTATASDCSSSGTTTDAETFRLPPILEPGLLMDKLIPIVKTENVSVEDSLGANVDSASIFSGASSSHCSSSRSSRPGSSTSEIEDFRREIETKTTALVNNPVPLDKNDGEEGESESSGGNQVKDDPKEGDNHIPMEDIKMPVICLTDNKDSLADSRSNLSISSSLRAEHSATVEDSSSVQASSTIRMMRNRCNTSRRLLPPPQAPNLSVHRAQTAKLSPSASSTALVVNSNSNAKGTATNSNSSSSSNSLQAANKVHVVDREREQGGDYLIEICGRYLNVYGLGALKFVDKQWNVQKAGDVHTVKFSYINYNNISGILGKIKSRFPNAENYVFRETNITCLGQLNSLAEIQGLQSMVVEAEGNLICTKKWRSYAVFRLSHWGLKQINGQDITETELEESDRLYGRLPDLVLWSLPEALLAPLLSRLRLEEPCQASRLSAKDWLLQADPSLKSVVGKEALQWRKSPIGGTSNPPFDEQAVRTKGKLCLSVMMENTCNAVEKLEKLDAIWSGMLTELIRNTLIDYSQLDTYVNNIQKTLPP